MRMRRLITRVTRVAISKTLIDYPSTGKDNFLANQIKLLFLTQQREKPGKYKRAGKYLCVRLFVMAQ